MHYLIPGKSFFVVTSAMHMLSSLMLALFLSAVLREQSEYLKFT